MNKEEIALMTNEEIDILIEMLREIKFSRNPYAGLKELSNKAFGEEWSENWIVQHCPNFIRDNGRGHDLYSERLGRIEVKSSRLPCKQITFNQIHPTDCEYFLFVLYHTDNGTEEIFLVPSSALVTEFSLSVQHQRTDDKQEANCFTMSPTTQKNKKALEKYRITSWEELNGKA